MLVTDFLRRAVRLYPGREAIVSGGQRFTYGEFDERVRRLANGLRDLGVRRGDRIALLSPNSHRFLECFFATAETGAILAPLNYRLVADDFRYIINHAEAEVFIVDTEYLAVAEAIRPDLPHVRHFISWGDAGPPVGDWLDYEELLEAASSERRDGPAQNDRDLATLNYTSGTTARPKGVMLSHRNIAANAMNFIAHLGITDRDTHLHIVPMFHCNGWGSPYAVTGMGGRHVVLRRVDAAAIFDLIGREGVTLAGMAPAVLASLLEYAERQPVPAAPVRIICAGAPPPLAHIERLRETLGWEFVQVYGLTETSPFLTISRARADQAGLEPRERDRRLARAGEEMLGVDLRVVDPEGRDVPTDDRATGEVIARGDVIMEGYWREPEATAEALAGGWLHTGDLATWDEGRSIQVVDRKKDVIISGGENISSIEIEGILYRHPSVREAAVIAVPDERWGETVKAIVVLHPGAAEGEAEILAFCRQQLAHFKCPTSVDFLEALPRTATGKLQKFVLRERYWSGHERRVH